MKCKNLATTNFSNFDAASQECIQNQVLSILADTASIASSITGVTGGSSAATPAKSATAKPTAKRVVFLYNAQALNADIYHPVLLVSIQSVMPHIHLQVGTGLNDSSSPRIHCVMDTATALCTSNYHFFAAIAKQYPQCVAKIFLPEDY